MPDDSSVLSQIRWGHHGKPLAVEDFVNCPGTLQIHFESDPNSALESASKLFQRIKNGNCQGDSTKVPHVTYHLARSLIKNQLADHGQKKLKEWWNRYEKLATEFALEDLDTYGGQPLDDFIPYDLFVKGASHYFDTEDDNLGKTLSQAVGRMPKIVSDTEKENVLLHFPNELAPFFEKPKNEKETKIQTDRQNKLKTLILKKLKEIFKDYEVTFIATETESQKTGSFITVQYTNDPQADDSKLGDTKTRDLPKDLPEEGYKNIQHDEKPLVYVDSIYSNLESQEVVIQAKESEKAVDIKLERWAHLITYVTTHELLHAFGIPHLDPPKGGTPLLMDEKIAFDLLSYWRGASEIAKIKDADLLRKLLTPKQKTYLKFILKKKAPANKTGYLDLRREKKTMGCEFDEINGRCYYRKDMRGPSEAYFDLFKDEQEQEVIGYRAVDPQDLYQPPGAENPIPVRPDIAFREDTQGRILSLGHFFGRPVKTLHPGYYDSYFTPHYSMADLLAVTPTGLDRTEIALLSNDLFNILIDDDIPHWEEPITDDELQLPGILERLKKIAVGEFKPPRVYKEDAKQKEYEDQNSKRALEMIHFYWRLGSDEAGWILDLPQFKELLQKHNIERKPRFEQITQKLVSGTKKPAFFALPKMTWDPHGKTITTDDYKNCPKALAVPSGNDPIDTLQSVSKLFQLIEKGECPGDRTKVPHVTYRLARPLIEKQLTTHGQNELGERWSHYEKLATTFALEELDTAEEQSLDGFIPYDFFVKGASHHFGIQDDDLEDMLFTTVHQMPLIFSTVEKENVLLSFPNALAPFFEKPKNAKEKKIQTNRQNELKELILKKLEEIFKDYEITFKISTETKHQQAGSFITVQYTNNPQTGASKLGETKTKDFTHEDWLEGLPGKGYQNRQHDEKPDVYLHSIYSRLKSEADLKKVGEEFVIRTEESENVVDVKLERWARLIAYVTTHELLHAFGIPHSAPPEGRTLLLMDEKIALDLLTFWRGRNDIAKIKDVELLQKLLMPKQKAYLDFILKEKVPLNENVSLDLRWKQQQKTMSCKFEEINGRCYFGTGLYGPEGNYFDLFKDENGQEVEGYRTVDPQDLFQLPGAKEFSSIRPDIPFREDREGSTLSLGHFFGRPIETLHPAYYHSYFTTHYSTADLLAVTPTALRKTEVALMSNDLFNFLIDDDIPHWEEPIADDRPKLPGILERLKKIVVGELKPPRVYKEDAKQKEYEDQNSKRALEMIHFYWRLGSDEAGKILDSSPFKELLKKHNIERKPRFEQITQKLKEQKREKEEKTRRAEEPKTQGGYFSTPGPARTTKKPSPPPPGPKDPPPTNPLGEFPEE